MNDTLINSTYRISLAILFSLVSAKTSIAADTNAVWDGSFLNSWSDTTRWTPEELPNNGATTYDVEITQGNVIQDVIGGVTINNLNLTDAFLSGAEPVEIVGDPADALATSTWAAVTQNSEIRNIAGLRIGPDATLELLGSGPKNLGDPSNLAASASLLIEGTANLLGSGALNAIGGGATIETSPSGVLNLLSDADFGSIGPTATLKNVGSLTKMASTGLTRLNQQWTVENSGSIELASGILELQGNFYHEGALALTGGSLVLSGDTAGAGNFDGSGTVTIDGTLSPGDASIPQSIAENTFGGDVSLGENARVNINLAGSATGEFDVLSIAGTLDLDGDIVVTLPSGADEESNYIPASTDSFVIVTATAGITGTLDNLVMPTSAPEGFRWASMLDSTSITLFFETEGLPGDFNEDGTVDAADYTVWRDGLGSDYTADDYNVWRANFGSSLTVGQSTASVTSVPEPMTWTMSVLGLCIFLRLRRE